MRPHESVVYSESNRLREKARRMIPGGAHTYAKGDDQYPDPSPGFLARGAGCHVWDADGNEYIEYGMGLRAVTLGHAFAPVIEAAAAQLPLGGNFTRPAPIEVECAEELLGLLPGAEMVKFCKDGSMAVDGAVKLARAHTGRDMIAICGDHPFFSTNDWFIGSTEMPAGIPEVVRKQTVKFGYNNLPSLQALFDQYPSRIACAVMEAARTEEPRAGFLEGVKSCCQRNGAVFILDEMITGFRWHLPAAHHLYGVEPDLSTFGKALANGFSVSALTGKRELMQLGGIGHDRERVFLLSTTHGAETHGLAAAIATMRFYKQHPVIETLYARGERLRRGLLQIISGLQLDPYFEIVGRDCNLAFGTRDSERKPSQPFRTLFLQEMIRRGVIAPSFVVSYSHTENDIDRTVDAAAQALKVYRKAIENGCEKFLEGRPVKPVFRRFA
jgi:glutamate-1-semialdehyde 2,1-aminomutase